MKINKLTVFFLALFVINACNTKQEKNLNTELKKAKSLYLLMHADNPVNWHIYTDSIWQNAARVNKLVLLSFGYSACHWCHVMEKENFEDTAVARVMNTYYYNVKIDREEFPDLDNFYASQQKRLIGWAGWPMHFILSPQKKIIWTGIYLPKGKWISTLKKVAISYANNHNFRWIQRKEDFSIKETSAFNLTKINNLIFSKFDTLKGGLIPTHYARKYPNTGLFSYLLTYYHFTHNPKIRNFLQLTLDRMYQGGIFDQVEGGFFRFSLDENWHIPHFEKMLYTNALMATLYAKAFKVFGKERYKNSAQACIEFVLKNLSSNNSLLFSSIDADSEKEGAYYIFKPKELKNVLSKNYSLAADYYGFGDQYLWKDSFIHLQILQNDSLFCLSHHLLAKNWKKTKEEINLKLQEIRAKRKKPLHDNKLITSWNALLIIALAENYQISGNEYYILRAKAIARVLTQKFNTNKFRHYYLSDDKLFTHKALTSDYLYLSNALIKLYQVDFTEKYLYEARKIFDSYLSQQQKLYAFPNNDEPLPDNIVVKNQIAKALNFYFRANYLTNSLAIDSYHPENYGYYLNYVLYTHKPVFELIIAPVRGTLNFRNAFFSHFYPTLFIALAPKKSKLPCNNSIRAIDEQETYYLCLNNFCYAPTNNLDSVLLTKKIEVIVTHK